MKARLFIVPIIALICTDFAHAFWGTGAYYANPMCPWPNGIGGGAYDEDDELDALEDDLDDVEDDMKEAKKKATRLKRFLNQVDDNYRTLIETRLNSEKLLGCTVGDLRTELTKYWDSQYSPNSASKSAEYSTTNLAGSVVSAMDPSAIEEIAAKYLDNSLKTPSGKPDKDKINGALQSPKEDVLDAMVKDEAFKPLQTVSKACISGKNGFQISLCNNTEIWKGGKLPRSESIRDACKEVINDPGIDTEIAQIKETKKDIKDAIKYRKKDLDDEWEDKLEAHNGCWECAMKERRKTSKNRKWEILGGTVGALGSAALGYLGYSQAAKYNAKLGWGTNPYGALGYAFPFFMGGLYGAINGGFGAGGFGCAGGMGGGGFGMGPMGMMGPYGGMYGMGGMGGFNPMMNPYAMMNGGMFMPGMGPWGGMGMGPGMGMGMGMGMGLGMGMGGMGPWGPGMGMGGMGPWGPGMGMGMGMGLGMGMGGMGPWGPGMGMGGPWGGMGMGPWGPGMGMGGMGGLGMPGMMPGGGTLGFDYQSQMMQQYQMQLELQMQMQMRVQQEQQQRMRIASDLQMQLYQLQAQLQNVLYGGGAFSSYGGGGGGYSLGIRGGIGGGVGGGYAPYGRRRGYYDPYYRRTGDTPRPIFSALYALAAPLMIFISISNFRSGFKVLD